ncbi:MAG: pyridoxal 5'-phosphate synthase glutaminase subunit PdxT [Sulfolobales archaeon]
MVVVGVLSLQGDFLEHLQLLSELSGVRAVPVKSPRDLVGIDTLIIPGGESTAIGSLMRVTGMDVAIADLAREGKPVMGTCAGAVLLAKKVVDRVVGETGQPLLELMNIAIRRNAFGRQRESFETEVFVDGIGTVRAVFIRAPAIVEAWGDARIVGYLDHPDIGKVGTVAIQNNVLAVTFHPEISGDTRLYEYMVSLVRK